RALAAAPREWTFASASADSIRKFACPIGTFLHAFTGTGTGSSGPKDRIQGIVNALATHPDGEILVSGGDNGTLAFYDWRSGQCFQRTEALPQPGSLEAEQGIFAASFDQSGLRLITCEADKSIKIWKEDENDTRPD